MDIGVSVIIRTAVNEDVGRVYEFICDLEETNFNFREFEEIFRANLLNKNNVYLVAESEGIVAGFISCHVQLLLHHSGWIGEIQEFYVMDEMRRTGTGMKLLHRLKEELTARGVQAVEVTAHRKRMETHSFYEHAGFDNTHKKFVLKLQKA